MEGAWSTSYAEPGSESVDTASQVFTSNSRALEANSHLPLLGTVPDRPTAAEELLSLVRACARARPVLYLTFAVPAASRVPE